MSINADWIYHEPVYTNGSQNKHNSSLYVPASHWSLARKS